MADRSPDSPHTPPPPDADPDAGPASEPDPDPDPSGGSLLWHGAGLLRVTAIDLAILAGHMLLYPTGMLPEHPPKAIPLAAPPDPQPDQDRRSDRYDDQDQDPRPAPDRHDDPDQGQRPDRDPRPPPDRSNRSNPSDHPRSPRRPHSNPHSHPHPRPQPAAAPASAPPAGPSTAPPRPPVLLVHGFADNRSAFALLRRSLHRNGWSRVEAVNYSPLTSDIRTAAERLAGHVERIHSRGSGEGRVDDRLDIVAHSLGGLIARYYVQRLGGDAHVRTLVTLGTPHSGTRAVPALVPLPLARQMRPGSSVLAELAGPAKGCRTDFVAFWSDLDQLMIPVGSARLEHDDLSVENVKVSGIGHLALPVHGSVAAQIRRALSEQLPPGAAADAA